MYSIVDVCIIFSKTFLYLYEHFKQLRVILIKCFIGILCGERVQICIPISFPFLRFYFLKLPGHGKSFFQSF